jgi:hypothetical protein
MQTAGRKGRFCGAIRRYHTPGCAGSIEVKSTQNHHHVLDQKADVHGATGGSVRAIQGET